MSFLPGNIPKRINRLKISRLTGLLVENGEIQGVAFIANGDISLSILTYNDLGFVEGIGGAIRVDLVDHILELEGQVPGNAAGLLPGEDLVQVVGLQQGPVGIQRRTGLDGEAGVEISDELRQIGIALLLSVDASQAHLLDQPILQGLVDPFNPSLGLGSVSTQDGNIQFLHGPPELGQVVTLTGIGDIDPENAVFIGVEPAWAAMGSQILSQQAAVAEETLFFHEG